MTAFQGFTITTVGFAVLQMNLNYSSTETKILIPCIKISVLFPILTTPGQKVYSFPRTLECLWADFNFSFWRAFRFCLLVTTPYWHRGVLQLFCLTKYSPLLVRYDFLFFFCFSQRKSQKTVKHLKRKLICVSFIRFLYYLNINSIN